MSNNERVTSLSKVIASSGLGNQLFQFCFAHSLVSTTNKVIFENNICVKGCKNFKLKSYIHALLSLGKIKINLPPEECSNGINALLLGCEYYENKNKNVLQPILVYNEFDCQSLYVLLEFIRKL